MFGARPAPRRAGPATRRPPSAAPAAAPAIVFSEFSNEARFQLDLKVPDAALAAFFPSGFTPNVAAQGAAKDCNLRAIFIDRVTINGPDGRPLGKGSNRLAYLVAPAKDSGGANVQLVIGGLTEDPADAPGPFGNYLLGDDAHDDAEHGEPGQRQPARSSTRRTGCSAPRPASTWRCTSNTSGASPTRATRTRRGSSRRRRRRSSRSRRQEQVLDILRNTTTNPPDRVKEFSFKAAGGSFAKLFDGTEKLLSWDNIIWMNRWVLK